MPCAFKIQTLAVRTTRPLVVASYFAPPIPMSAFAGRMLMLYAYLHALQPFLDRAGRGCVDDGSEDVAGVCCCWLASACDMCDIKDKKIGVEKVN